MDHLVLPRASPVLQQPFQTWHAVCTPFQKHHSRLAMLCCVDMILFTAAGNQTAVVAQQGSTATHVQPDQLKK